MFLNLKGAIAECRQRLRSQTLPRKWTALDHELIIQECYEFWYAKALYGDFAELKVPAFPSDELLDNLHLYEGSQRKMVQEALQAFAEDFAKLLQERGYDEWAVHYPKIRVEKDTAMLCF